jgi:hypothetical protein
VGIIFKTSLDLTFALNVICDQQDTTFFNFPIIKPLFNRPTFQVAAGRFAWQIPEAEIQFLGHPRQSGRGRDFRPAEEDSCFGQ